MPTALRLLPDSIGSQEEPPTPTGPFSAIVRKRTRPARLADRRYEVVVLEDDQPVLLCRRQLELPVDWDQQEPNRNPWKTVEPPAEWVEQCDTLERARALAAERSAVLNTLAHLFDANTAVSLYKRWEGEIG